MVGDKIHAGRDYEPSRCSVLALHAQNIRPIECLIDAVCSSRKRLVPNDKVERNRSQDGMGRVSQRRTKAA